MFVAGDLVADSLGEAMARIFPLGVDLCNAVDPGSKLGAVKPEAFVAAAVGA